MLPVGAGALLALCSVDGKPAHCETTLLPCLSAMCAAAGVPGCGGAGGGRMRSSVRLPARERLGAARSHAGPRRLGAAGYRRAAGAATPCQHGRCAG